MKFKVTIKHPDAFDDAIHDAVQDEVDTLPLSSREKELVRESRREEVGEFISKWVEYGEYICVEFDTEAKTATVVPRK